MYYILKVLTSAMLIMAISEISKRSTLIGGIMASIPLISVLAMVWMYFDKTDINEISKLSSSVFWLVIPSLALFVSFPILVKKGLSFFPSLGISIAIMLVCYYAMILLLGKFGIKL